MNRDALALAKWALNQDIVPLWVHAAATRLTMKRKRIARVGPTRKSEKRAATTARSKRMSEIREEVKGRTDGRCVICGAQVAIGGECHHILSGPLRRSHESADTCAWLCQWCHREVTANKRDALLRLAAHCAECGMVEAARVLARRLAKLDDNSVPTRRIE